MLFSPYYAKNYAGIIGTGLTSSHKPIVHLPKNSLS